jgi:hypothetical protein
MLAELDDALRGSGVTLCFAEMKDPVKDKLRRFDLFARFEQRYFATIDEAVGAYLDAHPHERALWSAAGRGPSGGA